MQSHQKSVICMARNVLEESSKIDEYFGLFV